MHLTMKRMPVAVLLGAFALATIMWATDFQPVSSESTRLVAVYAPGLGDSFLDLNSSVWKEGTAFGSDKVDTAIVPLSAQYFVKEYGGSVQQVKARAAHDDKYVAFWLQWQDNSKNVGGLANGAQPVYSDAAAVEFPLDPEQHVGRQAFRCMGQIDALVNIWQWKAERDGDLTRPLGFDPIQSNGSVKAAKNWIGPNVAYLIDPARYDPDSRASYDEATKTWTLVFKREMKLADKKHAVDLVANKVGDEYGTQIAFAVWDGGNGERLSKKAVSTWVDLTMATGDKTPQAISDFVILGIWGVLLLGGIGLAWKLLPGGNKQK